MTKGTPPRVGLPITATILSKVKPILLASSHLEKAPIWAIACTAFFGFFRLGELLPQDKKSYKASTDLVWGDVALDNHAYPPMVRLHLKKSKCDQFGKGVDVVVGRTGQQLCPFSALLDYIDRSLRVSFSSKPRIYKPWFIKEFQKLLVAAGLPEEGYTGHSFRIGAATTAAVVGIPDSTIKTLGRWQSAAFLYSILKEPASSNFPSLSSD